MARRAVQGATEGLGELTLPGYRLPVRRALLFPFQCLGGSGRTGWGLLIEGGPPAEEPSRPAGDRYGLMPDGAALFTENEPLPLPPTGDWAGLELALAEPRHPDGEPYLSFAATDPKDVSDLRIRFGRRAGGRYWVELSAVVHRLLGEPADVRYVGWVEVTLGGGAGTEPGAAADGGGM